MITWRNIDAIDTRGAQLGLSEASRTFQGATDTLSNLANQQTQLNIRGDEQEQLRRLNQARAQLLGTTSSDALNQYDLNTLGQQFGLDAANTATLQDVFSKQLNEVQSDEYKAAEELRNVAKSDLDLRQGEQSIKLAGEAGNRAQQLFAGQLTGQKLQNLSSEASLNDTLRNQNTQSYLDSSVGTFTAAMASGATESQLTALRDRLVRDAVNSDAATKVPEALQAVLAAKSTMTPEQAKYHNRVVEDITTKYAGKIAAEESKINSLIAELPVTPQYGIMESYVGKADWVDKINTSAPAGDLFKWTTDRTKTAYGSKAKDIVDDARKAIENDSELLTDLKGITNKVKVPDHIIAYTIDHLIKDPDNKTFDMRNFQDELRANYVLYEEGRHNNSQIEKAKAAFATNKNNLTRTMNAEVYKSYDEVLKNDLMNRK